VLQSVAECCRVLQCAAVCCSVLQCVAVCCSVLQCVAVCCSVLQCVAECCRVLQYVGVLQSVTVCPLSLSLCHTHTHTHTHTAPTCTPSEGEGSTGWPRLIGCLIFIRHVPQKIPIIIGSFAKETSNLVHLSCVAVCVAVCASEWRRCVPPLSRRSLFAKDPLIIGLFSQKSH